MKRISFLSLILCSLIGAEISTIKAISLDEKYRRSSITMLTIIHPADSFSTEIQVAVKEMPFPDKYDQNDLGITFLEGTPNADRKADLTEEITEYLNNSQFANKLINNWFCGNDSSFNMNLISQRGHYDATIFDVQQALETTRGKAMLADAGEELINKTFVLINDISYIDHKERAEIVEETSRAVGETAKAVGDAAGSVLGMFGGLGASIGGLVSSAGDLVNTSANILSDVTDMLNISGFVVRINSYLFQLDWNEESSAIFYNDYYTTGDTSKIDAFWADTTNFKMKFVGKYEQYTNKGTIYSKKSQSEQILVTCTRTLDKNISNLQKTYPVFQVKTPIHDVVRNKKDKVTGYLAYIGLKEGIDEKSKFTVLEKQEDENGRTIYKKVGSLKPEKGKIWDNRYMAEDEIEGKSEGEAPLNATVLTGSKDLMPGMLIIEGKFDKKAAKKEREAEEAAANKQEKSEK